MKQTLRALLGFSVLMVMALTIVIVSSRKVAQASTEGCNNSSIAGIYGFAIGGLVSTTFDNNPQRMGDFYPLAAVGTFSFDGHGTSSRSITLSFGGQVFPVSDSGPYTVNPDCTASATYSDGTWNLVIVSHGKEIKAMNTSPGTAVQGVLTKQ